MTTQNSKEDDLADFIESTCGDGSLRVENDFGDGYVRLKSTEAQKRQAVQDIRSTENVVIELLRNARDAGARHIFLALQHDGSLRTLVAIDDGSGIPAHMHERVFEPRVTSKLDTAHMDKWGMHGRGMALYSISVNAQNALVQASEEGKGSSFVVQVDIDELGEKTDQSTFPHFELNDDVYSMRGPRNILRTTAEFALEHRHDCEVYCGSFTEIAATLYGIGRAAIETAPPDSTSNWHELPLIEQLACTNDPDDFATCSSALGMPISSRSARRILDGTITAVPSMISRIEQECFEGGGAPDRPRRSQKDDSGLDRRKLHMSDEDIHMIRSAVEEAFDDVSSRYFLECGTPEIHIGSEDVRITVPIRKLS